MIAIPKLTIDDIIRFWSKAIRKSPDECWIWVGGCTGNFESRRRPVFKIKDTNFIAARISWYIKHNEDPGELLVCHTCQPAFGERQLCVNPDHLWLGTYGDNRRDSLLNGRGTNNRSSLQEHDVLEIRRRYETGESTTKIGLDYNITRHQVWMIGTQRSFPTIK